MDDQLALAVDTAFSTFADTLADQVKTLMGLLGKIVPVEDVTPNGAIDGGVDRTTVPVVPVGSIQRERHSLVPRTMPHLVEREWSRVWTRCEALAGLDKGQRKEAATQLAKQVCDDLLGMVLATVADAATEVGWSAVADTVAGWRGSETWRPIAIVTTTATAELLDGDEHAKLRARLQPFDIVKVPSLSWHGAPAAVSALIYVAPLSAKLYRAVAPALGWRRVGDDSAALVVTEQSVMTVLSGVSHVVVTGAIGA